MKDKIKNALGIVITIAIIVFGLLWYPWFVKVEDGKTTCHNVFGYTMDCK